MIEVAPLGAEAFQLAITPDELLPMPFGGPSNVFVLRGEVSALIDTGYTGSRDGLIQGLAELGLKPDDIGKVFLSSFLPGSVGNLELFADATLHISGLQGSYFDLTEKLRTQRLDIEARAKLLAAQEGANPDWDLDEVELGLDLVFYGAPDALRVTPVDDQAFVLAAGRRLQVFHSPGVDPFGTCYFDEMSGVLFGGPTLARDPRPQIVNYEAMTDTLGRLTQVPAKMVVSERGAPDHNSRILFRALRLGVQNLAQNISFALDGPTTPITVAYRDMGYWPEDLVYASEVVARFERVLHDLALVGIAHKQGEGPLALYSMEKPG